MKQLDRMKDFFKNLSGRTKKIIAITVSGLLILSAALAMALNNTDYAVLFSGVNEEEAKEVMAKLRIWKCLINIINRGVFLFRRIRWIRQEECWQLMAIPKVVFPMTCLQSMRA